MSTIKYHDISSPAKIATVNLGIAEDYKQQCIQEAYRIGDQQNFHTNVKAIMSSYRVWEESKVYNPLFDKIVNSITDIIFPTKDERFKYNLINAWVSIYKDGHYTIKHDHTPASISFTYYLKSPISSAPLVFNECNFKIDPYDDLIVVFPSYLTHSVPKHKGEDRICIAGNLILREK